MSHIELEFLTCSNCLHIWCYRCAYHEYFLQSENPPYQAIKSCKNCSQRFTTDQIDYFLRALNWGIRHSYWDWCPAITVRIYLNSSVTTAERPSAILACWKPTSLDTTRKWTYRTCVPSVLNSSAQRSFGNYEFKSWNTGIRKTQHEVTPSTEPSGNVRKVLRLQEAEYKTNSIC